MNLVLVQRPVLKHGLRRACAAISGSWDLSRYGWVYSVAPGPYGTFVAGCWDVAERQARLVHVNPHADGASAYTNFNSARMCSRRSYKRKEVSTAQLCLQCNDNGHVQEWPCFLKAPH